MSQTIARPSNGNNHIWWFTGRDSAGRVGWVLDCEDQAVRVPDDALDATVAELDRLGYSRMMAYPCDEPPAPEPRKPCWLRLFEALGEAAKWFWRLPR